MWRGHVSDLCLFVIFARFIIPNVVASLTDEQSPDTLAQNRTLRVGSGFGLINNVLDPNGGGSRSSQQTYFLAEVLKYQYLIQAEKKGEWDVLSGEPGGGENKNFFVYNTEAHPIKVATKNPV